MKTDVLKDLPKRKGKNKKEVIIILAILLCQSTIQNIVRSGHELLLLFVNLYILRDIY
jgi:hypothetical protein